MSSPFSDLHAAVNSNPLFTESVTYKRAATPNVTETAVSARVRRGPPSFERVDRNLWKKWIFQVVVVASLLANEPAVQDVWNLKLVRDAGSAVGFSVQHYEPGDGVWIITAVYRQPAEVGGGGFGGSA